MRLHITQTQSSPNTAQVSFWPPQADRRRTTRRAHIDIMISSKLIGISTHKWCAILHFTQIRQWREVSRKSWNKYSRRRGMPLHTYGVRKAERHETLVTGHDMAAQPVGPDRWHVPHSLGVSRGPDGRWRKINLSIIYLLRTDIPVIPDRPTYQNFALTILLWLI